MKNIYYTPFLFFETGFKAFSFCGISKNFPLSIDLRLLRARITSLTTRKARMTRLSKGQKGDKGQSKQTVSLAGQYFPGENTTKNYYSLVLSSRFDSSALTDLESLLEFRQFFVPRRLPMSRRI